MQEPNVVEASRATIAYLNMSGVPPLANRGGACCILEAAQDTHSGWVRQRAQSMQGAPTLPSMMDGHHRLQPRKGPTRTHGAARLPTAPTDASALTPETTAGRAALVAGACYPPDGTPRANTRRHMTARNAKFTRRSVRRGRSFFPQATRNATTHWSM